MKSRKIKILLYDVESFPNLAYIWGKYEQNAIGDMVKERKIVSFSYKWLGERNVYHIQLPMFPSYKYDPEDNSQLIKALHGVMSEADIIVGHNIDKFDDRMSNTDMIKAGLRPPPPHKTIDTLKVARKYFAFNSNKLDDLGASLGLGRKKKTGGFALWLACMEGRPEAWAKMEEYNNGDVDLLEKILNKFSPWMANYPDLRGGKVNGCVVCDGRMIAKGWRKTKTKTYRRYQCSGCGHWDK